MKIGFCTYYRPATKYTTPTFMAKHTEPDWNSDSGKLIEKTLEAMSAVNAVKTVTDKNVENEPELIAVRVDDSAKIIPCEKENLNDLQEEQKISLNEIKQELEKAYKNAKDPDILNKHAQLYQDAYKNRDLLKGGYPDLSDSEIDETLVEAATVDTLDILGKGTLEAAFALDLVGFNNLCVTVSDFKEVISKNNLELLKKKINPANTNEYRNLEEEVKKDKRKINKLLGKENILKRQELSEKIEILKDDKNNFAQVKELKREIQNLYKNCENSEQIKVVMQEICEKQKKMKELLNQKVDLSPQEIINKVWTIAAISQSDAYKTENFDWENHKDLIDRIIQKYDKAGIKDLGIYDDDFKEILLYAKINKRQLNKDIKDLINLIKPITPENEKIWKKNIDKKLYEFAGYEYDEGFANLLNLSSCKYLNELIVSDDQFWNVMPVLLQVLSIGVEANPPEYTLATRLDIPEHNYNTAQMFEALGIDYVKWAYWNKNSFINDKVVIKAEDAKHKAVKNMCHDLATLYSTKDIPKKERDKIFDALKEFGISVTQKDKHTEIKLNGRNVEYSDLASIMSIIKRELNNSSFWSEENTNEKVENRRDMMYNHLMIQRKQEIDNVKKLKESEVINVKVQKVDMSDVKHSLCLGNHSHCCTALGSQSNEWAAPLYILNRCISAIEVLANDEPVGNTMIYMAHVNGELALILDDIELQAKYQNNDKIRDMIIKYSKQLCEEIGKPNIPIYAGPGMHKVDMTDYKMLENAEMVIIGETPENGGVYLDFDGEGHDIGNVVEKLDLYKIA